MIAAIVMLCSRSVAVSGGIQLQKNRRWIARTELGKHGKILYLRLVASCSHELYSPIHATRFIIGGSIEERILALQEKKKLVFEGTVGHDVKSLTKLTEEDMRFLFSN